MKREGGKERGRTGRIKGRCGGYTFHWATTTNTTVTRIFYFHTVLLAICDLLEIVGHILFNSVTTTASTKQLIKIILDQ